MGHIETVSFKEARSLSNGHIKSLSESQEDSKRKGLTVSELIELFRAGPEPPEAMLKACEQPKRMSVT